MDYWCETNWYAIHAHPAREGVAAVNIERFGLQVFLPQIKEEKLVWGFSRTVVKPLFSGYLFANFCPANHLHHIQYARGVRRVVGNGHRPLLVDDEIIRAVRSSLGEDGYAQIQPNTMHRGDRVIVQQGPLEGLRGVLEQEVTDDERVVVLLEAIEYQARLLIDKGFLKKQARAV
jgi:transcriptional antiterminator RfaH